MPNTSELATGTKMCTWVCPDDDALTGDEQKALAEWIRAHGLNPEDYYEAAVLTDELHLTEVVKDEQGWPVVDYAANQVVTRPKVVRLMAEPPFEGKGRREVHLSANTHSCKCAGNLVWSAYEHESESWLDHLEQIQDWLKLHSLDPSTIRSAAVVMRDSGLELHAQEYLTCPRHADARYVDLASDDMATRTRVLPLIAEPPVFERKAQRSGRRIDGCACCEPIARSRA